MSDFTYRYYGTKLLKFASYYFITKNYSDLVIV